MYNYEIFTESTADLTQELVGQLGVQVIPMEFTLDGKDYLNYPDNRQLSPKEFYDGLRNGGRSTTAQVNSERMKDAFRPVLSEGKDLLYLVFSSGLSGTWQSAQLALEDLKEEFPQRNIRFVNTLNASMGEGLMVWYAAKMREKGDSLDQVADYMEKNWESFNSWFTVDDLMFLKRGGRLSGGAAIAGTLLGIKPVLHVDQEGHLINMEKVRGRKSSLDSLARHYREHGLDKENNVVFISHGDCLEDAKYLEQQIRQAGAKEVYLGTIGPVIGAHSGPGTVALFFWGDGR